MLEEAITGWYHSRFRSLWVTFDTTGWYQRMVQILGHDGLGACSYACIGMVMVVMHDVDILIWL